MVVENIGPVDADHALATRGIGIPVGAVDKTSTAVGQVLAGLVDEWAARVLGSSNANTVSGRW